jgi:hypothetical protein
MYVYVYIGVSNMDARTTNDLKIIELLLNGNEYFTYSYDEMHFNIHSKDLKHEYALRVSEIRKIYIFDKLVDQSRIQIIMEHGGYIYINLSKNFITVGL